MRTLTVQHLPLALALAPMATARSTGARFLSAFASLGAKSEMTAFQCRGMASKATLRSAISSRTPLALGSPSFWGRKDFTTSSAPMSGVALSAIPPQLGDHPVRTEKPSVAKVQAVSGTGADFSGDLLILPVFQVGSFYE